jgi:Kdo2-lipid IVA lauroyltransferase/acyltransferase
MSKPELEKTTSAFYTNFTDVFLETIKLLTIPGEELVNRLRIKNPEAVNDRLRRGQSLIALTSHYCNWEWMLASCSIQFIHPPDGVYLRVKNPFFEKLMLKIRSRFGAYMIEKKYILSEENKRKDSPRVIAMVADQAPKGERSLKWIHFLNQETPFINGPERISKILDLPVVYGKIRRIKRGYYEMEFVEIKSGPGPVSDRPVTEKFATLLEENIREYPPNWLWSHNRWKQTRPEQIQDANV